MPREGGCVCENIVYNVVIVIVSYIPILPRFFPRLRAGVGGLFIYRKTYHLCLETRAAPQTLRRAGVRTVLAVEPMTTHSRVD